MKKVLLSLAILSSFSAFAFPEIEAWPDETEHRYEQDIITWQKVVRLKTSTAKNRLRGELKAKGVDIVAQGPRFLAIRPGRDLTKADYEKALARLMKDKAVESVTADSVQTARAHEVQPPPQPPKDDGKGDKRPPAPPQPCKVFAKCNGENPAWPKYQVGADLADALVKKTLDKERVKNAAKIAVVDSGFDALTQKANIDAISLKIEKGTEKAGNPNEDREGHGTAVAGLIAGKIVGVTSNAHLTVLRVTEPNAGKSASTAAIAEAIIKACKENDVVNVSFSGLADELGMSDEDKLWKDEAAKSGCIVVKSAGNLGIKRNKGAAIAPEDPKLLVGSSDAFSDESTFSSVGGLFAPGEGVYSLNSALTRSQGGRCGLPGGGAIGTLNGTSFAAPIVSGIAGQIIGILRARGELPADPKDKIKLVKNILMASAEWGKRAGSRQAVVNALTAALIAQAVTKDKAGASIDDLIKLGSDSAENKKRCDEPLPNPMEPKLACDKVAEGVHELRYRFFACFPTPKDGKAQPEVKQRLYRALGWQDEDHLRVQVMERSGADETMRAEIRTDLGKQWDALYEDPQDGNGKIIVDPAHALSLMQAAKRSGIGAEFNTQAKFNDTLYTPMTQNLFNFFYPIGQFASQQTQETNARLFAQGLTALSEADQIKVIGELASKPRGGSTSVQQEVNFLYFLSENMEPFVPAVRAAITARLKEVAEAWMSGKLPNTLFNFARFVPSYDKLFSVLPDAKKRLEALVDQPLNKRTMAGYVYAVGSPTAIPEKRYDIAEKVLNDKDTNSSPYYRELSFVAIRALVDSGDVARVKNTVKPALLDNPIAQIPLGAIASKAGGEPNAVQKEMAADGFFPKYVDVTVKRATERLANNKATVKDILDQSFNFTNTVMNNKLFSEKDQRAYFGGDGGAAFEKMVDAAAARLIAAKEYNPMKDPTLMVATQLLIQLMSQREWAITSDAKPHLLKGIQKLLKDVAAMKDEDAEKKYSGELLDALDLFLEKEEGK